MPRHSIFSSPFVKGDRGIFYFLIPNVIRNTSLTTAIAKDTKPIVSFEAVDFFNTKKKQGDQPCFFVWLFLIFDRLVNAGSFDVGTCQVYKRRNIVKVNIDQITGINNGPYRIIPGCDRNVSGRGAVIADCRHNYRGGG